MTAKAVISLATPRKARGAVGTRAKTKKPVTTPETRNSVRVKSESGARAAALLTPRPSPQRPKSAAVGRRRAKEGATENLRTSQVLRNLLEKNPGVENFTVEQIVSSIGNTSFGASLMFFSIPEVIPIPIPAISALVVLPTAVISTQMVAGKRQIRLPKFLLKRTVPRKAVAVAIKAILPFLEKAEKRMKRRWEWATNPLAQRLLGIFIFLLALSIAFPIPGFNMPQAVAIFIIALGLVEKDGLVVIAGVLIGLAAMAVLGAVVFGLFTLF